MSKQRVSQGHSQVLHDIEFMTEAQLIHEYGIEISEDGFVWDPYESREFDNVNEWGQFMADLEEEENYATTVKVNGKWSFDDERF